MFGTNLRVLVVIAVALLALSAPGTATAGTDRYTTITSLPYTINSPGGYRLTGNLTLTTLYTSAITINSDNVVLDLDGFTIVNGVSPAINGPSPAIKATGRSNITIRNGKLRGFWRAIQLTGDGSRASLVVEDITAMEFVNGPAIFLENTTGAIVRRCQVANTILLLAPGNFATTAIRMSGKSAVVHDNVVTLTKPDSGLIAIDVSGCRFSVVERNSISNDTFSPGDNTVGIEVNGVDITVADNRIANMYWGVRFGTPVGVYRDNITVNCINNYTGGTDAGNNH